MTDEMKNLMVIKGRQCGQTHMYTQILAGIPRTYGLLYRQPQTLREAIQAGINSYCNEMFTELAYRRSGPVVEQYCRANGFIPPTYPSPMEQKCHIEKILGWNPLPHLNSI